MSEYKFYVDLTNLFIFCTDIEFAGRRKKAINKGARLLKWSPLLTVKNRITKLTTLTVIAYIMQCSSNANACLKFKLQICMKITIMFKVRQARKLIYFIYNKSFYSKK